MDGRVPLPVLGTVHTVVTMTVGGSVIAVGVNGAVVKLVDVVATFVKFV